MSNTNEPLWPIQVGVNSCDLVGSARLFGELGFRDGGGHVIWGHALSLQGLDNSARGLIWWLVGRERFMQLEIFNHTNPMQRPLPADWRACDLGWTRFGIAVPDIDDARATLARWNIPITGESAAGETIRRIAFRDPFIGCYIEILEDHPDIPGGQKARHFDIDPTIVYATSSVSDLDAARDFYTNVLEMTIDDDIVIHGPEHEGFWGLNGARSKSFVVRTQGFLLEIVQYLDPVGRARPADYRASDQGIVNVCIGTYEPAAAKRMAERVKGAGCDISPFVTFVEGERGAGGAYVFEPERELEIGALSEEFHVPWGFVPVPDKFGNWSAKP